MPLYYLRSLKNKLMRLKIRENLRTTNLNPKFTARFKKKSLFTFVSISCKFFCFDWQNFSGDVITFKIRISATEVIVMEQGFFDVVFQRQNHTFEALLYFHICTKLKNVQRRRKSWCLVSDSIRQSCSQKSATN